jgi:hypothetical protein
MKKSIYYLLAGGITVAMLSIGSCSDDDKLPAINGFNNSDEVASENLLAHWTFDGTNEEEISGAVPSDAEGNTFSNDAVKGKSLDLDEGFLLYPTITALSGANAMPSVTVSAWVNITNNNLTVSSIFNITQDLAVQTDWNTGGVLLYAETNKPLAKNDTLVLHSAFSTYITGTRYGGDNINDYGVRGTDFQTLKGTDRWVHYVMRYNGAESNIDIYADGVRISNNNFRHRTYNPGTGEVGLGNLTLTTPTRVLIGGFPTVATGFTNSPDQGWQGLLTGKIDEIRVFNKALSDLEIGSLFALESEGR